MLGFRVSDAAEDAVIWLRCNQDHHGIALLNAGHAKVNHYAYDLADWNDVKRMCDHLWRNDVPIIYGPSRHGPGHNIFIYVPDPAGNVIELTTELEQIWGRGETRAAGLAERAAHGGCMARPARPPQSLGRGTGVISMTGQRDRP